MKKGMMIFWVCILILVVAGLGMSVFVKSGPSKLEPFAQCISDSGSTFYGAFWCPHCQAQKRLFGSAADLLPYVECSTPNGQSQLQGCKDKNIKTYPTWEFKNDSRLEGEISLMQLSEKTSCQLPE